MADSDRPRKTPINLTKRNCSLMAHRRDKPTTNVASQSRAAKRDVRREARVDEAKAAQQRRSSGGEPNE